MENSITTFDVTMTQGTFESDVLATTASKTANNKIRVRDIQGITTNMAVYGANIAAHTYVTAISGTELTLSLATGALTDDSAIELKRPVENNMFIGNNTGEAQVDSLSNAYSSNTFDIASFIVRRTSALPEISSATWTRDPANTPAGTCELRFSVSTSVVNAGNDFSAVYGNNGKISVTEDVVKADAGTGNNGKLYFLAFGAEQKLSGYYTLRSVGEPTGAPSKRELVFGLIMRAGQTSARRL